MDRDQRIRDPIHNLVSFSAKRDEDQLLWRLLQTAPVQRLRRIKQLGFSEFVYPGATHTRFSHVVGAMEMARRMLRVFERNEVFSADDRHKHRRKATLAAALLHDVGHGPYSHVFEDVSSSLGVEQHHEEYTKEIIGSGEIRPILDEFGVFDDVTQFFSTEPGFDPYTAIITSQMDCDRLDFLSRDRYHTGIRSSSLDLDWLFDSLRIDEVPLDPASGTRGFSFVVLPKGVSAAEEFVISYVRMYQNIYFHKTTRAVQHLVKDILTCALQLTLRRTDPLAAHPLYKFSSGRESETSIST